MTPNQTQKYLKMVKSAPKSVFRTFGWGGNMFHSLGELQFLRFYPKRPKIVEKIEVLVFFSTFFQLEGFILPSLLDPVGPPKCKFGGLRGPQRLLRPSGSHPG